MAKLPFTDYEEFKEYIEELRAQKKLKTIGPSTAEPVELGFMEQVIVEEENNGN